MALKYKKPVTPGQRDQVSLDLSHLKISAQNRKEWSHIFKALKKGSSRTGGRNHTGAISIWGRGGGHKRSYRKILFRKKILMDLLFENKGAAENQQKSPDFYEAKVLTLVYDPYRSSSLALLELPLYEREMNFPVSRREYAWKTGIYHDLRKNALYFYILAPKGLSKGDSVPFRLDFKDKLYTGESLLVEKLALGTFIHNIEIHTGKGGQLARAAGTFCQILENSSEKKEVRIRIPSGQDCWIPYGAYVSVGILGNEDRRHLVLGKAGRNRWLGRRPTVRGVAMNPVDHPHGGGEGRSSGGRPSVTPWGRNFPSPKRKKAALFLLFRSQLRPLSPLGGEIW